MFHYSILDLQVIFSLSERPQHAKPSQYRGSKTAAFPIYSDLVDFYRTNTFLQQETSVFWPQWNPRPILQFEGVEQWFFPSVPTLLDHKRPWRWLSWFECSTRTTSSVRILAVKDRICSLLRVAFLNQWKILERDENVIQTTESEI